MLATIDQLKLRAGVEDDSQDNDLTLALEAASDKVLDLCGYVETDIEVVDYFEYVKQGFQTPLSKRPVSTDASFLVEGRGHGTAFGTLTADLVRPDKGEFMILAAGEWWPPTYRTVNRYMRWREPEWPVVRATYTAVGIVAAGVAPQQLVEATVTLANYWWSQSQPGARSEMQIGQIRQAITDAVLPPGFRGMLGKHYRGAGAMSA